MKSWVRLHLLGKGSFGSVFKAISSDGFPLAVKSSLVEKCISLRIERLILEYFIGCPGIVQCYGGNLSIEKDLYIYNLLLEYASGGCLHDLMNLYGGRIPELHASCYARMILKGLSEIHKRGFVHCDLKPENILVFPAKDGGLSQVKIADFGLAKVPGEELPIQRFTFRGTPLYMSPESVADGKIEAAMDVWSLGCVVLEMITGERPWKLNTKELICVLGLLRASPRIPNCLSEEGKDFLSKCFEINPQRRWTAEMLLKHPFVEGEYTMCPFSDCLNSRVEDSIVGNFKRLVLC